MSLLMQVENSTTSGEGLRIVVAGVEKVGKTTLCADAPGALLIPLEVGYSGVRVMKTPMLNSFNEVMNLIHEITEACKLGKFPYKTLVFDSATALERLIHTDVLSRDPNYNPGNKKTVTMDSALGGYGKGFQFANELFDNFLKACDMLAVYAGLNIVLTCHVFASKVMDPSNGEYDSWDLLLHSPKNQKTYGKREMLTQWADIVGFLYEPIYLSKVDDNHTKAVSANKGVVLGVKRTPSYVAGNRFGMCSEIPIPQRDGWNHLAQALYTSSGRDIFKR
jgi:hypothetical protein